MSLEQNGLYRMSVPLMIIVASCKEYSGICDLYNLVVVMAAVYYDNWNYSDRKRNVIVNIAIVIILLGALFVGVVVLDLLLHDNEVFVIIILILSLMCTPILLFLLGYDPTLATSVQRLDCLLFLVIITTLTALALMFLYNDLVTLIRITILTMLILLMPFLRDQNLSVISFRDIFPSDASVRFIVKIKRLLLISCCTYMYLITIASSKKQKRYVNAYQNYLTDMLFMCTDFESIVSLARTELFFFINNEVKKYRETFIHCFNMTLYCLVVFVSAGLCVWLFSNSLSLVYTQVDPLKHITFIDTTVNTTSRSFYSESGCLNYYERHFNEDVRFTCDQHVPPGIEASIRWTHNGNVLNENGSERIIINHKRLEISILLIEQMDYGDYQCFIDHYVVPLEFVPRLLRSGLCKKSSKTYRLMPPNSTSLKLSFYVDVGGLVYLRSPVYLSLANPAELTFTYTVNGVDVHTICESDSTSCSWKSYIIKIFFARIFQDRFIAANYTSTDNEYTLYVVELWSCICSSMYGVHEVTIYRHFFNNTIQRDTVVEIIHPVKYVFYPKQEDALINDELYQSNVSNDIMKSILEAYDEVRIPDFLWFTERKVNVTFLFNVIALSVFGILFVLLFIGFNYVISMYCCVTRNIILYLTNRAPCRQVITNSPLAGIEGTMDILYDVYLSSNEEDDGFAMSLVSFLETKCHLRVCFPARDLVHEMNLSYFSSFSRATEQCRKFIVILSRHYIEDYRCNNVQLMSCIIPLIHATMRQGRDLILLKLDKDIAIPIQIRYHPDVTIINYTTDDDIEAKRKIRRVLIRT